MIFPSKFKVTLTDGEKTLSFTTDNVVWLPGGDSKVEVTIGMVDYETGSILDEWEDNGTELDVKIEVSMCSQKVTEDANEYIVDGVECPQDVKDYNEQEGKATLTWVYDANGNSKITLTFTEVE